MADWAIVRELALALPEVDLDETRGGRPRFQVRGKGFAWMARERDGGGLAVRVDPDEKELILKSKPRVYYDPPHYRGFPRSTSGSRRSAARSSRNESRTPG